MLHVFKCSLVIALLSTPSLLLAGTDFTNPRHLPFRLGMYRLNPAIDRIKPMAPADPSGWVLNGDVLVGALDDRWVVGFSLVTKRILWWLEADTPLATPIGNFGSSVILIFRNGKTFKVDAATGQKLWEHALDTFSERPLTLVGSQLLVFTAGQQLYSIDFQSGATGWLYDAGFPEDVTIQGAPAPAVDGNLVLIGLASGEVRGVDLASGKLLWNFDPEPSEARFRDVIGELAARERRMFMARYDGIVGAVDLGDSDRTRAWQENLGGVTTTALRAGRYYVGAINGDVIAFDGAAGKRLWRVETGQAVSTITVTDKAMYVTGGNGRINVINPATGEVIWFDDIGGSITQKPIFYKDGVYFFTGFKNIYGYLAE